MKKRINVQPVTEIELVFEDGSSLDIKFDAEAISNFNELDGGITAFIKEDKLPERCAKIIYVGARSYKQDFTLDEARKITSELSPITITEIVSEFNESMGAAKNGVQSEMQKKLMEDFTKLIMK
ncbi:MAG: hypothetical protein K0R92_520 [Lachnospiraceae bacterium]|jgi:hypothetical protein|nr:hypothetical protein [Lachnospiraceae bacterium]